ncbi:hypothetical protein ACLBXM_14820 [Xanthobacteraceae bacterium A53D]
MTRRPLFLLPTLGLASLLAACATPDGAGNAIAQRAKVCSEQIMDKASAAGVPHSLSYDGSITRNDGYSTGGAISATVFSSQTLALPYVVVPAYDGAEPGATWRACMNAAG